MLLVLSSPSGAGKTTLTRRLLEADSAHLIMSISATTRPPRPTETNGVDYHFIDGVAFGTMQNNGDFLESAKVFDYYYGTPKAPIDAALAQGKDVLLDIDWQGTQRLRGVAADDLVRVFILPPSIAELERRLKTRAADSPEVVARRMAKATDEISHYAEYDYIVVNNDLDESLMQVHSILRSERLRRTRQLGLPDFVQTLQLNP